MHAFRRCLSVRTAYSLCSLMTSRPSVNIVSSRFFRITVSPYLMDRTKPATQILQNLTPEDSTRLDCIKSEHAIFIASGKAVPLKLSDEEYLELLCCPSLSARNRYYLFRFKIHKKKEAKELKRSAKNTEEPVTELVQKNQILRMIRSSPIRCHRDDWLAAELRTADTSAQTLVIDCSHEEEMRQVDQRNLAKQISMVYSQNRAIRTFPFHLMLTSLVPKTNQYHFFEQTFCVGESYQSTCLEAYPWTIRSEHFSEIPFNRRVVYLSPNASRAFEHGEFDHDAVYVVGGIVDKAIRRPVTHARARRSGIECMRLPLERYMHWRSGNKTLTLVAMHGILAAAKETNGDWKAALERNIPKRCLREHDAVQRDINRLFRQI